MNDRAAQNEDYITKKEMAARLKVTPRTIDVWMAKRLVPFRKIGRAVRFHWGEVHMYLEARSRPVVEAPVRQPGGSIAASLRQRAKEIRQEHAKGNSGQPARAEKRSGAA